MIDESDPAAVTVTRSETNPAESPEYDFSMTASVTLAGPRGTLCIRRRYNALPRHNDVLEWGGADTNDEFLDRADELYAHSKFYAVTDGIEDYFLDRHETWRPADPAALSDEAAFFAACEAHHLADVAAEYTAAMDERRRKASRSE